MGRLQLPETLNALIKEAKREIESLFEEEPRAKLPGTIFRYGPIPAAWVARKTDRVEQSVTPSKLRKATVSCCFFVPTRFTPICNLSIVSQTVRISSQPGTKECVRSYAFRIYRWAKDTERRKE